MAVHDPAELTAFVKDVAVRSGFGLVGVTTPDPPLHLDTYEAWLALGRHGEMSYLATPRARQRRANPLQILPECRSILVVGANYLSEAVSPPPGRIAAYAVGQDYHDVLPERLQLVVEALQVRLGRPVQHKIYTDSGPLLERELAQRAGLGWIGKNTCLIHPRQGSYFFLAELMLDVELVPDTPFTADHCGSCIRCIQACPTQCILPDRTLQADACISYLTIELKGNIPATMRPLTRDWLFGCDVCQQVCPWNRRFAQTSSDGAFQPLPWVQHAGLAEMLAMDEAAYRLQLRHSPLKRARRSGLLRNAAVAAGNTHDERWVPALRSLLLDAQEPGPRAHAAWALGRIGGPQARQALRDAAQLEMQAEVQDEIRGALDRLGPGA